VSGPKSGGRRLLFLNVLSGAGAQGLTALAALWSIPQLLIVLGSAGYGTYSIATALVGYLSIADLGLNNATLQRLARSRTLGDIPAFGRTVGTSVVVLGGIGVGLMLLLLSLAPFLGAHLAGSTATASQRADVVATVRWCGVGALPVFLRPVPDAMIAASEKLTRSYGASTIANLVRTVGAVVAVWIWQSVLTPVIVLVAASTLQLLMLLPLSMSCVPGLEFLHIRVTRRELRELLGMSVPLWFSQGAAMLANQLDRFVVSSWFGLEAVGYYAVAQDLATRLWILPYIFGRAYFARLANAIAHDAPRVHERTIRDYDIASVLACGILAVPLAISSHDLISAWTGLASVGNAPTIFVCLSAGMLANCAAMAPFAIVQIRVDRRALGWSSGLLLATHVVGCTLLPRVLGPAGAAVSWAAAQTVFAGYLHSYVRASFGLRLLSDLARCIVAFVCVGALLLAVASWVQGGPVDLRASTLLRVWGVVPRLLLGGTIGLLFAVVAFRGRLKAVLASPGPPIAS
jgi:O-antigen/teichoic acid export membrane protein